MFPFLLLLFLRFFFSLCPFPLLTPLTPLTNHTTESPIPVISLTTVFQSFALHLISLAGLSPPNCSLCSSSSSTTPLLTTVIVLSAWTPTLRSAMVGALLTSRSSLFRTTSVIPNAPPGSDTTLTPLTSISASIDLILEVFDLLPMELDQSASFKPPPSPLFPPSFFSPIVVIFEWSRLSMLFTPVRHDRKAMSFIIVNIDVSLESSSRDIVGWVFNN